MECMDKRVLVVGGGIGGLALAAGLHRKGVACEVWEASSVFRPAGAGIVMGVNAMGVLHQLGAQEHVVQHGRVLGKLSVQSQDGRDLNTVDLGPLRDSLGISVALHRQALHDALHAQLGACTVRLGTTVDSLLQDADGVTVKDNHGSEHRFALVVGADGLHSRVRGLIRPGVNTRYSGYTCWRTVVPDDEPTGRHSVEMWGRGRRVGLVGIGDGRMYAFFTLNAPRHMREDALGAMERLRARFGAFGGRVPGVLARLTGDEDLLHHDIDEVWVDRWSEGRVTLLGDAAHGMTPNMGQGAAMALEDAWVLATALGTGGLTAEALQAYERLRKPRVSWVHQTSRRLGEVAQWENGLGRWVRDGLMTLVPERSGAAQLGRLFGPAVRRELGIP